MERNTVNIDIESYNELLIKAHKYDKMKENNEIIIENKVDSSKIKVFLDENSICNKSFK
ncbi:hypothetical protein PYH72_09830 [Staphylococcus delphini]|uniref:hypothetical protein n=1 Tax=Staphylococcus delphini TaxID=53344 RepID=UPI0021CDED21|nr:hypothetical protein [Staphylococcus delphini]UXS43748.1 hypothetical protein MUA39_10335 [Staphylococcus delphini]UXV46281.1 hypothetical protein MUA63_13435 [Staphylococcus delphini]